MNELETRRINPISRFAMLGVAILVVFEVLVICGVLELKANTVAKYAPWAYEPFIKLVGEHPDSSPRWAMIEEKKEPATESEEANVTGLEPSAIPLLVETNAVALSTNVVLEATTPQDADPEPIPVLIPTNAPKPETIVPVG